MSYTESDNLETIYEVKSVCEWDLTIKNPRDKIHTHTHTQTHTHTHTHKTWSLYTLLVLKTWNLEYFLWVTAYLTKMSLYLTFLISMSEDISCPL